MTLSTAGIETVVRKAYYAHAPRFRNRGYRETQSRRGVTARKGGGGRAQKNVLTSHLSRNRSFIAEEFRLRRGFLTPARGAGGFVDLI